MKNKSNSSTYQLQFPKALVLKSTLVPKLTLILKSIGTPKLKWSPIIAGGLAGIGMALGHISTTSNCTLPQQGRCSTCGSCVIAIGALVAWAVIKKPKDGDLYHKN